MGKNTNEKKNTEKDETGSGRLDEVVMLIDIEIARVSPLISTNNMYHSAYRDGLEFSKSLIQERA